VSPTLAPAEELQAQAFAMLRGWLCDPGRVAARASDPKGPPLAGARGYTTAVFTAAIEKSQADLRGIVPRFCDQLREILTLRQTLMVQPGAQAGLERDLAALLPPDFLRTTPYAQLPHFPRYLKGMKLRAERWRQNPAKDAERAGQLASYVGAAGKLREREGGEAFRWLVEEFRVSLFAQELGTAEPVSAVKLDRVLAALQHGIVVTRVEPPPVAKPILAAGVTEKKIAPVKNFGALDRLFPR